MFCLLHVNYLLSDEEILKILNSAIANASNNESISEEELYVTKIFADNGPRLKRFKPKARGRAGAFDRPSSHLKEGQDPISDLSALISGFQKKNEKSKNIKQEIAKKDIYSKNIYNVFLFCIV